MNVTIEFEWLKRCVTKYVKHEWIKKKKQSLSGPQVLELQDCVSRLQELNNELQNRLSLLEMSAHDTYNKEDQVMPGSSPWKQVRGHQRDSCS